VLGKKRFASVQRENGREEDVLRVRFVLEVWSLVSCSTAHTGRSRVD
jgi:hypothetical protein